MSLDKIVLITIAFSEYTIFLEYISSKGALFRVAREIRNLLVTKIRKRELIDFDKDPQRIFSVLCDISSPIINVPVKDALLDLAEVLEMSSDSILRLASHAIRVVLYYRLEENLETLMKLACLVMYIVTISPIIEKTCNEEMKRAYRELALRAYEEGMNYILNTT